MELIGFAFVLVLFFLSYQAEKKIWNKGICKENGKEWQYFDTDSQGGRGYTAGDHTCWISWPCTDTKQQEQPTKEIN